LEATDSILREQQRQLHAGSRAGHRPGYTRVWVYELDPDAQARAEVAWAYQVAEHVMAEAIAAGFDGRL
jgi:hypothetical protein